MVKPKKVMLAMWGKSSSSKMIRIGAILMMLGVAFPLVGFVIPSPLVITPTLVVQVYDADTGQPVQDVDVYVFSEGAISQPKENAVATAVTGLDGEATIILDGGFYKVGLYKEGYVSAETVHTPSEEYQDVWTAWGAAGVRRVIEYPFQIRNISAPDEPMEPDDIDVVLSYGSFINFVTLAGAAFIVSGIALASKEKRRR